MPVKNSEKFYSTSSKLFP